MYSWSSRSSSTPSEDRFGTTRLGATGQLVKSEDKLLKIDRTSFLQSATVDVSQSRVVHVTTKCIHGVSGGRCGATHCGLGAVLPIVAASENQLAEFSAHNSYPTTVSRSISYPRVSPARETPKDFRYSARTEPLFDSITNSQNFVPGRRLDVDVSALDDVLADVDVAMENKTTTQWRSSFQNVREKFRDGTPPRELQLAADASQTLPKYSRSSIYADGTESTDKGFKPIVKSYSDLNVPSTTAGNSDRGSGMKTSKRSYKEVRQELLRSDYLKQPLTAENVRQQNNSTAMDTKKRVSNFWLKSLHTSTTDFENELPKMENETSFFTDYSSTAIEDAKQYNIPEYSDQKSDSDINFSELNSIMEENSSRTDISGKSEPSYFRTASYPPPIIETVRVKPLANGTGPFPEKLNFSALDSAVEAVQNYAATEIGNRAEHRVFKNSPPVEVQLVHEMSNYLQKSVEILNQEKQNPTELFELSKVVDVPSGDAKNAGSAVSVSHSPSPDTSSNTSDTPAGLPHPKPKHHLREQLQSIGLEPRSPTNFRGASAGWSFSSVNVGLGAVAERVLQFEKFPTKQLKAAEAALNSEALKSFFGKGTESVYKAKPVIRVNFSKKGDNQGPEENEGKDEILSGNLVSPAVQPSSSSPVAKSPVSDFHFRFAIKDKKKEPVSTQNVQKKAAQQKIQIPRFYFPKGRPISPTEMEMTMKKVSAVFAQSDKARLAEDQMSKLMKACDFPLYWKKPVFMACGGGQKGFLTQQDFTQWWTRLSSSCYDEASRFVFALAAPKRNYLTKEDFEPLIQDIVDTFPGLYFLREAPEFHSRYIQTVIARIFFGVNRSWTGKITVTELRNSNFLDILRSLETVDDINMVTEYFSYEHFYVIYCKFWELDRDHDLFIDRNDLARHDGGAISMRIIDRVFSGAVNRGSRSENKAKERLSYADFVSFLVAEEDKRHPTSVEYWFRCLDVDGDGVLSMFELQYFYEEQERKMMSMSIEPMGFTDVLCQMFDIIRPRDPGKIRLGDLKRCRMAGHFLNAFINVHKYYEQESSETERATVRSETGEEISDWDRFCAEEYEALMQEEQIGQETEINCDDSDGELEHYLSMSAPEATRSSASMSILDTL